MADFPAPAIDLGSIFTDPRPGFNKPAAPNAGIAPRFHSGHHWRGVGEPERCRKIEMSASKEWYRHGSDIGDGDCERDPLSESLQS